MFWNVLWCVIAPPTWTLVSPIGNTSGGYLVPFTLCLNVNKLQLRKTENFLKTYYYISSPCWSDCWRRDRLPTPVFLGFPCDSTGKESACYAGDLGSIPGLGRSPGEGKGYPLQYSDLENSMDYPWGCKELDKTERLSLSLHCWSEYKPKTSCWVVAYVHSDTKVILRCFMSDR